MSRSIAGVEKWVEILKKNTGLSWKEYDMSVCVCGNREKGKHKLASNRKKWVLVIKQGAENREIFILCLSSGPTSIYFFTKCYSVTVNISNYMKLLSPQPSSLPSTSSSLLFLEKSKDDSYLVTYFVFTWRFFLVYVKIYFISLHFRNWGVQSPMKYLGCFQLCLC